MVTLKKVLDAVLIDLIQMRHRANEYSQELSERYKKGGLLGRFSPPVIGVGNVKVDLKFASEAGEAVPEDTELPREDIERIFPEAVSETAHYFVWRDNQSNRHQGVLKEVAFRLVELVDPLTLNVVSRDVAYDRAAPVLRPHLTESGGRSVTIMQALGKMLDHSEARLKKFRQSLGGSGSGGDTVNPLVMNVDVKRLAELDPSLVSSISFDVSLDEMDWHESVDS